MNRKLATLLFAIGLGAASSAWAWPDPECGAGCWATYQHCVASGEDPVQCNMDRIDCEARCGI